MVEEQETSSETTAKVNGGIHQQELLGHQQQDEETGFRQKVEHLLLCPVCHETVEDPRQLDCGHFLCLECVRLLNVDQVVRCAKCPISTTVDDSEIRVDELAAGLLRLLAEFGPQSRKAKIQNAPEATSQPTVNGIVPYMDEDDHPTAENEQSANVNGYVPPDLDDTPVTHSTMDTPPTIHIEEVPTPDTDDDKETVPDTESASLAEEIIQPPPDYQSADEEAHEDTAPPLPPKVREYVPVRQPVEHGEPTEPVEQANQIEPTKQEEDLNPTMPEEPAEPEIPAEPSTQTEEAVQEAGTENGAVEVKTEPVGQDEPDRVMKASEMKPSDVAMSIEMERQCEACHSAQCTCNVSLLTPPVSNGSQLSVETNISNHPSEDGEMDIVAKPLAKFPVKESASRIEVAHRNKVYVTRWTYDESGAVCTFDGSGKRIKFVRSGHHSYSGITQSKVGCVFALNTSKGRIEEYSPVDGKSVKNYKLELCRDPQAVDIMPTGEILVVDQERNKVIIYPSTKKSNIKPRIVKNDLIKGPYDIASCAEGFYITCSGTRSLLKLDLDGNIIWKYSRSSADASKPKVLQGVCTDEAGQVYVVDRDNDAVLVFTCDGDLKGRIRIRERTNKNQRPWYVAVRDGIMAVLYSHNLVKTFQLEH